MQRLDRLYCLLEELVQPNVLECTLHSTCPNRRLHIRTSLISDVQRDPTKKNELTSLLSSLSIRFNPRFQMSFDQSLPRDTPFAFDPDLHIQLTRRFRPRFNVE